MSREFRRLELARVLRSASSSTAHLEPYTEETHMGMAVNNSSLGINVGGSDSTETVQLPKNLNQFATRDAAESHTQTQMQQSQDKPTDGSRACTEQKTPSYEDIQYALRDRLANNSEYQDLKKLQDGMSQVEQDFDVALRHSFTPGDGFITHEDLIAIENDPHRPQYVRDAAHRLRTNYRAWSEITGGDGRATGTEVAAFRERLGSAMRNIERAEEDQVRTDLGAASRVPTTGSNDPATGTVGSPGTGGTGGTTGGDKPPGTSTETPKPTPSTKPGMEGALENLDQAHKWIQSEIDRLIAEAAADPSKAATLQSRLTSLTNNLQAVTNMQNQISQMMSNLTKMWSDIAMNSVRNIK
ncbi:MAG: hypothetical protein ACO1OB_22900 [Archangium sp.]